MFTNSCDYFDQSVRGAVNACLVPRGRSRRAERTYTWTWQPAGTCAPRWSPSARGTQSPLNPHTPLTPVVVVAAAQSGA